jgi:hypothetical protein
MKEKDFIGIGSIAMSVVSLSFALYQLKNNLLCIDFLATGGLA